MSGLRVVLLAKDRHVGEPALRRFLAVGAQRGDGAVYKDYCIAEQAFLVEELHTDPSTLDSTPGRRRAIPSYRCVPQAADALSDHLETQT